MSDFIVSSLKYRPSTFEDVVGALAAFGGRVVRRTVVYHQHMVRVGQDFLQDVIDELGFIEDGYADEYLILVAHDGTRFSGTLLTVLCRKQTVSVVYALPELDC